MFLFKTITIVAILLAIFLRIPSGIKFFWAIFCLFWYQINFSEFGPDYLAYKDHYYFLSEQYHFEAGYESLVKFFKFFNFSFISFYTIISFIGIVLYFNFFYREIGGRNDSILLVVPFVCFIFYSVHINTIRQSISILIVLYAIVYIFKGWKGWVIYVLLVCFATYFHRSSMVAFIFPFVYFLTRKNVDWLLILCLSSLILYSTKINGSQMIVDYILSYFDNTLTEKIKFYMRTGQQNHFGVGFIDRLYILIVIVIIKINLKKLKLFDEKMSLYYGIAMMYLILQFIFFEYNHILQRLKYYFIPVLFIYWVYYISHTRNKYNKILFISLLLLYSLSNFTLRNFNT